MKFDADTFFNQGFVINHIDLKKADSLLEVLKRQVFNSHSGVYQNNHPPQVVSWSYHENQTPPSIFEFWSELAKSSFFDLFTLNYGDFSQLKMSAHKYLKNQTLLWHQDFHEALPINNVLYLADAPVKEEDGGLLEVGKWRVDRNGWGQQKEVSKIATVLPSHGTLVTMFNMNPTIVHAVTPMKGDYGRYSLICRMGYRENSETSKITQFM
jgi:hypothetical protein